MPNPPSEVRLEMLTPYSNNVLEPLTTAILSDVDGVTAHLGRFRVLQITLEDNALGQFTMGPMMDAAELLADAKVQWITGGVRSPNGWDFSPTVISAMRSRNAPARRRVLRGSPCTRF